MNSVLPSCYQSVFLHRSNHVGCVSMNCHWFHLATGGCWKLLLVSSVSTRRHASAPSYRHDGNLFMELPEKFDLRKQSCHTGRFEGCYKWEIQWNRRRHAASCVLEYEEACYSMFGLRGKLSSTSVINVDLIQFLFLQYLYYVLYHISLGCTNYRTHCTKMKTAAKIRHLSLSRFSPFWE